MSRAYPTNQHDAILFVGHIQVSQQEFLIKLSETEYSTKRSIKQTTYRMHQRQTLAL